MFGSLGWSSGPAKLVGWPLQLKSGTAADFTCKLCLKNKTKRQSHLTLGYFLVQYHFALHPPFNIFINKMKIPTFNLVHAAYLLIPPPQQHQPHRLPVQKCLRVSQQQMKGKQPQNQINKGYHPQVKFGLMDNPIFNKIYKVKQKDRQMNKANQMEKQIHRVKLMDNQIQKVKQMDNQIHMVKQMNSLIHMFKQMDHPIHRVKQVDSPIHRANHKDNPIHKVKQMDNRMHRVKQMDNQIQKAKLMDNKILKMSLPRLTVTPAPQPTNVKTQVAKEL